MLITTHIHRTAAACGIAFALLTAAGPASAEPIDDGSAPLHQDLRSPDARDAGLAASPIDLRSPDARDAALGYRPVAIAPTPVAPVPVDVTNHTLDHDRLAAGGYLIAITAFAFSARRGRRRRRSVGASRPGTACGPAAWARPRIRT